jgi:hypothetical protein
VYEWDCGLFENVPRVRCGIVVGLERCPRYGVGWKGISFAEKSCSNQLRTGSRE